ncbi:MAG TPA: hypothetical protein PKO36_08575, partial [Candidatus Hydrogenedentes bacterium]|nr:hypothetical protein [Candidatus Hydrogenedentota bacterium]
GMKEPKVGLWFLAGDSWWDAGVCDAKEGPYAGFLDLVRRDCRAAAAALSETADVVATDLLHTVEETIAAARFFNAQDLDAILFCPIIWTNDRP